MTDQISIRQINKIIRKFRIEDNSIVAIKSGTTLANKQVIERISVALQESGLTSVIIVIVDDFDDMSVLPEREMRERGWMKTSSVSSVTRRMLREAMEKKGDEPQENG